MVEPPVTPEYSAEYGDRTTAAVKSVLLEIGQILGSYKGKYAVVGGAVPWLLLDNEDMPHIGTIDIDLSLRPEQLGAYEYTGLVDSLLEAGYAQQQNLRPFQLVRTVPGRDGEPDIDIYRGLPDAAGRRHHEKRQTPSRELRCHAGRWSRAGRTALRARRDRRNDAKWRHQQGLRSPLPPSRPCSR